jgi:hypothetical protein
MTLAATQQNQLAPVQCARGSRTGARTEADFTITLPFNPKYVKVVNVTDRITAEWFDEALVPGAGNTAQFLTVAAGTRTFEAAGISVANNVVSVTVATKGLATDNDITVWEAWA